MKASKGGLGRMDPYLGGMGMLGIGSLSFLLKMLEERFRFAARNRDFLFDTR